MNFILIGKSGSGKSTLSKHICSKYGYSIYSIGDGVKEFINDLTTILHDLNPNNELIKLEDMYDVNVKNNYRKHMQLIGTNLCQKYFGKTCWCNLVDITTEKYIIEDCRFIHEYVWFKNENTIVIKIVSDKENKFNHNSETEILNHIKPNLTLYNNGSIDELYNKFDEWFMKFSEENN